MTTRARWIRVALMLAAGIRVANAQPVTVQNAWSRATSSDVGTVYFTLKAGSEADQLLSIGTSVAKTAQLHTAEQHDTMSTMRPIGPITLRPHDVVLFKPGGRHVMLMGLSHPLHIGDHVPFILHFAKAGDVSAEAIVGPAGASASPSDP